MSRNIVDLVHLIAWVREETIKIMLENGDADDEVLALYCSFLYQLGCLMQDTAVKIAAICGQALAREFWKREGTD